MNKKRTRRYKQGIFRPNSPEKYKGLHPITYRSQWELKYMRYLDASSNVVEWGSESVVVPYQNPLTGKVSRYFIDFNVVVKDKQGDLKSFLVEIKPYAQTLPPVQRSRNTKTLIRQQAEYIKNQKKWEAAEKFAQKRGMTFTIITEKQLGI